MVGSGHVAIPPKVWAEASSELIKSTNACESFHDHFKSNFNHSHPNIFIFIDSLKNIQSEIYIKLQNIHKPNSCHNNKLRMRQQLLNQLIQNYKEKNYYISLLKNSFPLLPNHKIINRMKSIKKLLI
ncbi:Dimer Tnp hAT domain-containing protein [Aphis craccivora]|uniref:Dimer Tnp hAT domain-containing protein n=1 Tax=Aphis craccivora TaxID=307492 RepID=A0A6G0YTZ8_APHCR|nr:Dimer Tnp hAT domain-containing protein [Aphis craccivora]